VSPKRWQGANCRADDCDRPGALAGDVCLWASPQARWGGASQIPTIPLSPNRSSRSGPTGAGAEERVGLHECARAVRWSADGAAMRGGV
jgi:hypothetical protein